MFNKLLSSLLRLNIGAPKDLLDPLDTCSHDPSIDEGLSHFSTLTSRAKDLHVLCVNISLNDRSYELLVVNVVC